MKDKMTIFYSKQTGDIHNYTKGHADMSYYGDRKPDFEIIYDLLVVDQDEYVLKNIEQFHVVNEAIRFIHPEVPNKYL